MEPKAAALLREIYEIVVDAGLSDAEKAAVAERLDVLIQLDVLLIDLALDGELTDVVDAWEAAQLYGDAALAERIAVDARRRKLLPARNQPGWILQI